MNINAVVEQCMYEDIALPIVLIEGGARTGFESGDAVMMYSCFFADRLELSEGAPRSLSLL